MRRKSDLRQAHRHIVNDRCFHDLEDPVYVSRWQWLHACGGYHRSDTCPQIFGKCHAGFYTVSLTCAESRNLVPCKVCAQPPDQKKQTTPLI